MGRTPSLDIRLSNLESHARALQHLEDEVHERQLSLQEDGLFDQRIKEAKLQEKLRKMKTILTYVSGELDDIKNQFKHYSKTIERLE